MLIVSPALYYFEYSITENVGLKAVSGHISKQSKYPNPGYSDCLLIFWKLTTLSPTLNFLIKHLVPLASHANNTRDVLSY
ncbi:hypothetical protein GCM10019996_22740 [Lentilactobacillus parakefiri]